MRTKPTWCWFQELCLAGCWGHCWFSPLFALQLLLFEFHTVLWNKDLVNNQIQSNQMVDFSHSSDGTSEALNSDLMSPHFIVVPWSLWLLELLGCNIDEESKIISITSINNQRTPGHELRIVLQYIDHLWLHQMSWRSWFYFTFKLKYVWCISHRSLTFGCWMIEVWRTVVLPWRIFSLRIIIIK